MNTLARYALLAGLSVGSLAACSSHNDEPGADETSGGEHKLDNSGKDADEKTDEAGKKIKDTTDDVGDKVDEATN
jgi:hypothetical protein